MHIGQDRLKVSLPLQIYDKPLDDLVAGPTKKKLAILSMIGVCVALIDALSRVVYQDLGAVRGHISRDEAERPDVE